MGFWSRSCGWVTHLPESAGIVSAAGALSKEVYVAKGDFGAAQSKNLQKPPPPPPPNPPPEEPPPPEKPEPPELRGAEAITLPAREDM